MFNSREAKDERGRVHNFVQVLGAMAMERGTEVENEIRMGVH